MNLDPATTDALDDSGLDYEATPEGGHICVVLSNVELPSGYNTDRAKVLIRLPAGFPDAGPDMFWTSPILSVGGVRPAGTEHDEPHLGQIWQRWSRHIGPHWRSGIDDFGTYLAYVRQCLAQPVASEAAA